MRNAQQCSMRVYFYVLFSVRFVCQMDYGKNTGPILMKLGERMYHEPRENPLKFGEDLNHKVDTRFSFFISAR